MYNTLIKEMSMKKMSLFLSALCLTVGMLTLPSCCSTNKKCETCCCTKASAWFGSTWTTVKSFFVKEEKKVEDVLKDVKKEVITHLETKAILKDKKAFKDFVKKLERKNVVVKFSATWCPACHAMKDLDVEFAKKFTKDVEFIEINVDNAKQLAEEYKIKGIPHYLFLKKGKKEKHKVGGMKKEQYEKKIKKAFKL
jgi:thioredoxin 1